MRTPYLLLVVSLLLALLAVPERALAQLPPGESHDDVQWEVRTMPYSGGPVRPGAELDGTLNALSWIGGVGFIAGYAISIYPATQRPEAAIPFVGPWLAMSDQLTWNGFSDLDVALCVVAGILQPAGIVVGILGLLNPHMTLVYTAPIGEPSPNDTIYSMRLLPTAPGADAGITLAVDWL
jgi:hypothetical protein